MKLVELDDHLLLVDENLDIYQEDHYLLGGKFINLYRGEQTKKFKTSKTERIVGYYPLTSKAFKLPNVPLLPNPQRITSIPQEKWGVHTNHCCFEHGCKYGDDECPVELGLTKQNYSCGDCDDSLGEENKKYTLKDLEHVSLIFFQMGMVDQIRIQKDIPRETFEESFKKVISSLQRTSLLPKEFIIEGSGDPTVIGHNGNHNEIGVVLYNTKINSEGEQEIIGRYVY